jgi:hypothetical protein
MYSLEDQPLGSDFDLYYSLFDLEISLAQTDLFSWVSPTSHPHTPPIESRTHDLSVHLILA